MTHLLREALSKIEALPLCEQDLYGHALLEWIAEEEAWRARFAATPDVLRRLAQEASEECERGETRALDELL